MKIGPERFEQGTNDAGYRARIIADGGIMEELLLASEASLAKESIESLHFCVYRE